MTFSICVREPYEDDDGVDHYRFGVAVTTRLPGVGRLCPFANGHGAVATQSRVNVELGRKGVEYLADGLAVGDALEALLNADDGRAERQLHGVGREGEFAFSGGECRPWYGHTSGDNFTVAGNLLVGREVIDGTAAAYAGSRSEDRPLAARLIDALAAGQEAGGDKRTDLAIQSAALLVETTADREDPPMYDDLRVDATETPIVDLRATYERAREADEQLRERHAEGENGRGSEDDGGDGSGESED